MKSTMIRSIIGMLLLGAVAVAGLLLQPLMSEAQAQEQSQDNIRGSESREQLNSRARKLEGTWRVQVTLRNCQTGTALRTFPAFLTFAQGGTLTETTTAFSSAMRSPGHGFWNHTRGRSFTAASDAFLFSPAGLWTGTQRIKQSIEIGSDPDHLESTASVEIFDTFSNLTATGCATATATRME